MGDLSIAGLSDGIRMNSARATFITNALENGAKIEAVQKSVGHEKINTTQMYDKTAGESSGEREFCSAVVGEIFIAATKTILLWRNQFKTNKFSLTYSTTK